MNLKKKKMILLPVLTFLILAACSSLDKHAGLQSVNECAGITGNASGTASNFNMSGLCYMNIGYFQKAVEDFTKAIEIDQDFANAYYNRSIAYSRLNYNHLACQDMLEAAARGDSQVTSRPGIQARSSSTTN